MSHASSIEQSVMVFECGRGCGHDRDFGGGCGSFGEVMVPMVVDRLLVISGPGNVSIAGGITT